VAGAVPASPDLAVSTDDADLVASVGFAMVAQRMPIELKPRTRAFLISIIGSIVPASLGPRREA
jgi:hypothetical protein